MTTVLVPFHSVAMVLDDIHPLVSIDQKVTILR